MRSQRMSRLKARAEFGQHTSVGLTTTAAWPQANRAASAFPFARPERPVLALPSGLMQLL